MCAGIAAWTTAQLGTQSLSSKGEIKRVGSLGGGGNRGQKKAKKLAWRESEDKRGRDWGLGPSI